MPRTTLGETTHWNPMAIYVYKDYGTSSFSAQAGDPQEVQNFDPPGAPQFPQNKTNRFLTCQGIAFHLALTNLD